MSSPDLSCPACGAELDLSVLFAHQADQQALARLIAVSVPLGARVMQYIGLHTPAKQRLTAAKKIKLVMQLLPDLERQAVTRAGRDWPAPLALWAQAIDQMLATRDAGRLELPLKGHGYLYAVLQGLADKAEASAEAQAEADRRTGAANRPVVQVRGAAVSVGQALRSTVDATLAALDQRDRTAAPMPDHIRQKLAAMRRKPADPNTQTE